MEMLGEARLHASRALVWDALNDPQVLQASIPGCESLERSADDAFTAVVVTKVGPIKARFSGKVTLSNIDPPKRYTLTGEGSGGAAGFAKADIDVSLDALEPAVTLLRYGVKANVGGKLAQLGSRMIDAAARKSADDFFALFGEQVEARAREAGTSNTATNTATKATFDLAALAAAPVAEASEPGPVGAPAAAQAVNAPVPQETARIAAPPPEVLDVLMSEQIKVWIADQIAVITLNRPASRNAMTYAMWQAMPAILSALDRDAKVRAVLLTGAGQDFCAGADIAEFERVRADAAQAAAYEVAVDACCDAITQLSKPTIAVLRGYCLGGGAHLAMSCDFRFAAAEAMFGIPAAKLSIIYGVKGTRKLLALVGVSHAKRILYGAERFDAAQALCIGFIDQVAGLGDAVPARSIWECLLRVKVQARAADDPMAQARTFAASLAGNAPLSIAGAKVLLNGLSASTSGLNLARAEALIAAAAASEDYREGRAAFAERRAPQFQGR